MTSNTLEQSSTNSEDEPVTPTIFPIMDLPIDIRIAIYRCTVPNIFRDDWRVDTKALRDDGRLCCPALLRTNKQLHNEVIDEFYGREYYGLWINPSGWHFAGNNGMPIKNPLPPAIRWVQKLDLTIYLGKYSDNFNYKALLGDYFRTGSRPKLRKLRLRLLMSIEFFELYRDRPTSLRRGMEEELYPLKEGRGLQEVIVHSINHEHAITVYGHEKSFEKSMGDMLAVMRRFLDEVAIVMMSPDLTVPGRKDSGCAF